jgi:hypothetical protein
MSGLCHSVALPSLYSVVERPDRNSTKRPRNCRTHLRSRDETDQILGMQCRPPNMARDNIPATGTIHIVYVA